MPSCKAYTLDSSLYPLSMTAEAQGFNQCKDTFLQNITSALETGSNNVEKVCFSVLMMYECLMYNQPQDARDFLTAMYGNSFLVTSTLTQQICMEVYQGKVPPEQYSSKLRKSWFLFILQLNKQDLMFHQLKTCTFMSLE